ncbi:hypothetical protein [Rhizobium mesoamericanum]|uniref:hypothetical protein n=1 Tax=Rhizobium mesoamericanum TaxID=1079800 RepID=UPI0004077FB7|nr:hypothetical protein [Rhizobium mesoamericanum]
MIRIGVNAFGFLMLLIGAVLMVHGVDNAHSLLGTILSDGLEWAFWGLAMCLTGMTVLVVFWTM